MKVRPLAALPCLAAVALLSPYSASPTAAAAKGATPVETTQILKEHRQNPGAAEAKYGGKTLLIRGKITHINDVFGVKALMLRDSPSERGMQCYLQNAGDVKKVKVGDRVTLRGKLRVKDAVADHCTLEQVGR